MNVNSFFVSLSKNKQGLAGLVGVVKEIVPYFSKGRKSKVSDSKVDLKSMRDPDFSKQKYWKPILFALMPLWFWATMHYWATKTMAMLGGKGSVVAMWLIWIALGLAVGMLSMSCAPKNDKGIKLIVRLYIAMALYLIVGGAWKVATDTNPLYFWQKYEVVESSVTVSNQQVDNSATGQLTSGMPIWKVVTVTNNGKFLQKVKKGQVMHIINDSGMEYSVTVESVGSVKSSSARLKARIHGDGLLSFQLPPNCTIKYYVEEA